MRQGTTMNKQLILISLLMCFLSGCSTKPANKMSYYLLNEAASSDELSSESIKRIVVSVQDVRLSGYLDKDNLAMQLDEHRVYYSHQDFWAEPLETGVQKALLQDLNQHSSDVQFSEAKTPMIHPISAELIIEVEHFLATDKSSVILSGKYWVTQALGNQKQFKPLYQTFNYSLPLKEDGYGHAVAQMRQLITLLSSDIVAKSEENLAL